MTEKRLQDILSDYSQMSVDSLIELKSLIEEYPYCQTIQILYLLNLRRLGEDSFNTRLPYTAICANNRQKLKCVVDKVDEILDRESGRSKGFENLEKGHHPEQSEETISKQISRNTRNDSLQTKAFRNKTISELLNLPSPFITQIKLPKSQISEDFVLEQLRQEAFSKVNEHLLEISKTEMVDVSFSETPKRMAATKALIDKVIETNPKISKVDDSNIELKKLSHWKIKEENSLREDSDMVSETLALLYVAQGAPEKAQQIYKSLSKKYPEKVGYFTQLSEQIKPTKAAKAKAKSAKTKSTKTKSIHKPKTKQ